MADQALVFTRPAAPVVGDLGDLVFGASAAPAPEAPRRGELVFVRPAAPVIGGPLELVFGASGGAVPDAAALHASGRITRLAGFATLRAAVLAAGQGRVTRLQGTARAVWDANVSRGAHIELHQAWQSARPLAAAAHTPWQQAAPLHVAAQGAWQPAQALAVLERAHWQESQPLRAASLGHWQQGDLRRGGIHTAWQQAQALRAANHSHWQQGDLRRGAVDMWWQETVRLRAASRSHWQDAATVRAWIRTSYGQGVAMRVTLRPHWQEGIRPSAGRSSVMPPVRPPCYVPGVPVRLVFKNASTGSGQLVFVCQRAGPGPQPGATVVIPVRRVYMTVNNVSLARADGTPIPAHSFTMSLDMDSWTWQWSASLHATALGLITPGAGGEPVRVIATVNGTPYRLLAESYSRERRFRDTRINVRGRGISALLDVPYSPSVNHGNALARTAQQLMGDVLTVNGVNFGWDVDWQLTDWLVPGGAWSHQGSYMSALLEIAGAAGGYIQPHDTAQTVRALRRYPSAPWDWDALTPDFELPSAAVSVEGIEWQRRATYDRIFVSGVGAGIRGNVKRAGTAGMLVAPGVTHPLITGLEAARQRGIAELSNTGLQAQINLRLPVLPETGVIKPGAMVRYVDGGTTHLGFVRGMQLEWQWPTLRQLLTVETHPE